MLIKHHSNKTLFWCVATTRVVFSLMTGLLNLANIEYAKICMKVHKSARMVLFYISLLQPLVYLNKWLLISMLT